MSKQFESPQWKRNIIRKRGKGSQTPGKSKNEWCQKDPIKTFFATNTKAYKHPHYVEWHEKFKRANGMIPGERKP